MRLLYRILFALLALVFSPFAVADILSGHVIRIDSGDAFVMLDDGQHQTRISVAGIAAPDNLQSFGNRAAAALGALIAGQEVTVSISGEGRNGYLLGKVMIADAACRGRLECPGQDVGLLQIMNGMAWWDASSAQDLTPGDREDYSRAEFDAKIHRRGLWSETNPVQPWRKRR